MVSWSNSDTGGDCAESQNQLKSVQHLPQSWLMDRCSLIAMLADGSVVAWGSADYGSDR